MELTNRKRVAALYIRVSSEEQAQNGTSLKSQEEDLKKLCEEGGQSFKVYRDDGYTGANLDRPAMQELLRDIRMGLISLVLTWNIKRLSRNVVDAINLVLGEFANHAVSYRSATEPFDSSTPAGRLMMVHFASFADFDREQIRTQCMKGRTARNQEGKYSGGVLPYAVGWDKEKEAFFSIEHEVKVYTLIFDFWIDQGKTLTEIGQELTRREYMTRQGVDFSGRTIRFMIENTAAYGTWFRHRIDEQKIKDPNRQKKYKKPTCRDRNERPPDAWIPIEVPAVVSKERWERAQEILRTRSRPKVVKDPISVCSGLLWCAECGTRVGPRTSGSNKPGQFTYGCFCNVYGKRKSYRNYYGKSCVLPNFDGKALDDAVWEKVEDIIMNPAILWEAVYGGRQGDAASTPGKQLEDLRLQLLAARQAQARALELHVFGADPEAAKKVVAKAVDRCRALEREILSSERSIGDIRNREGIEERAFEALTAVRKRLGDISIKEKREILRILVPGGPDYKILVGKDGEVVIKGAIDFEKALLDVVTSTGPRYDS